MRITNNKILLLSLAVIASIFFIPPAYATQFPSSAAETWGVVEIARDVGFRTMISNLLGNNSFLLGFARAIFIGFSVIGLAWYTLLFSQGGTDKLVDDKGIFVFIIYVLVAYNLLYNSGISGVYPESLGGSTPAIGVLGFDIYLMSDKAGNQIIASALGVPDDRSPVEALFNIPSLLKIYHEGAWYDKVGKVIAEWILITSLLILIGITWLSTTMYSLILGLLSTVLILMLPLVILPITRDWFFGLIKAIVSMLLTNILMWMNTALILVLISISLGLTPNQFVQNNTGADANPIEMIIQSTFQLSGALIVIWVSIGTYRYIPTVAGMIMGGAVARLK